MHQWRQPPGSTKLRHGEVAGASPSKDGKCSRISKADQTPSRLFAMFDIWRKINEQGSEVVTSELSSLSALGRVEVGEKYPDLMPEKFRRYDVYSDPQLICESPFQVVSIKGIKSYHFKTTDPVSGKSIDVWVDPVELATTFGCDDYHTDDEISAFGGVLVCSCGIAACAGIWSQSFHVSEKMIHWSVVCNDDEIDFFFERETYEKGALSMMHALLDKPEEFTLPGPEESFHNHTLESFKSQIEGMLNRRSYFHDMWNELNVE